MRRQCPKCMGLGRVGFWVIGRGGKLGPEVICPVCRGTGWNKKLVFTDKKGLTWAAVWFLIGKSFLGKAKMDRVFSVWDRAMPFVSGVFSKAGGWINANLRLHM